MSYCWRNQSNQCMACAETESTKYLLLWYELDGFQGKRSGIRKQTVVLCKTGINSSQK